MANSWQYDETSRRPLQQRAQIPESDSDSRFLFTRAPAAVAAAGNGNLMRASQGSSALVERGLRGLAANPSTRSGQAVAGPSRLPSQPMSNLVLLNGPRTLETRHEKHRLQLLSSGPFSPDNAYQPATGYNPGRPAAENREVQRPRGPFRPSAMTNPVVQAIREHPTQTLMRSRVAAGCSPNYRGDHTRANNRPAQIPEHENCSVFITGLPPQVTYRELLGSIWDTGRVRATVINLPTDRHQTAAAKVTFFTAAAARIFISRANIQCFTVGGCLTRVRPDRNRVAEATDPAHHTRCIMITGPREIVNVENLCAYFSAHFVYEIDEITPVVLGHVINMLEFRFGSYRCQAQWAWRNLREDPYFQRHGVDVSFNRDPCDW